MPATKPPIDPAPVERDARDRLLARVPFEAMWERELDSDRVRWDANLESIFGYPHDEVVNHIGWWRDHVHPDDLQRVEGIAARRRGHDG